MGQKEQLKLFEDRKVRVVWDDDQQEWYFSIVDVVEVLTDSKDPRDYLKKMRKRDPQLDAYVGSNCPHVLMSTHTGKRRKTLAGNPEQLFRIIQAIPSPKAEPFKQWMAQVAAERLEQLQDPELSIEQAVADYRRLGYSESWINQRLKSIEVRKLLTDEWKRGGVQGQQYASLTDIITAAWSGRTTKQYKHLKGLHKENLRDNMTNVELLLNSLAEASATEISKKENPKGYGQNADVARRGGHVAKAARTQLESQLGHSVVSPLNAKDYFSSLEQGDQKQIEDSQDKAEEL
jgi:hypothetical protein